MTEYYILMKVKCHECSGTGLYKSRTYNTGAGQVVTREQDCNNCKGKGLSYDPIKLNEDLINEIRRNFMRKHNA